ncbi:hypothetical protein BG015_007529 [Linnemannia schmuckeri]|uniref:Kinesin-like protein n=1 Tax=Linnemannia schmuckeri TaxID=64567 RepID=A0A9P5S1S4_9FUNG|nr:hypothetical protein BG015_007529 [Linnemannia schmuckeri]
MFKSVADRLGIPHSTSPSSVSSHHSNSSSSSPHHHHRTSIFSSTPSTRSPSRQQQQHYGRSAATNTGTSTGLPIPNTASGRTTPAPRKTSLSTPTPKPVLPPLSFLRDHNNNNLTLSVADAGAHPDDPPSRTAENVTVSVRVRPFSLAEMKVAGGPAEVWAVHEDHSRIGYADDYSMRERRTAVDYTYDHALTGSDNEAIYSASVKSLVQSAMEGYNGTVFAYGQTSSGKTYSGTSDQPGITPRAVEDVFKYIRENSEREFLLRVSYMEIYNESIRDLLSPEAIDLKIHEDRKRGVYVSPLKEEIVTTPSQVMRIIQRGDYQRHTSSTDYNAHSSRSHSIFQIVIESRERAPTAPLSPTIPGGRKMSLGLRSPSAVRVSQLNLIDLAGSEKASTDAERRKEGAFINKSLLTLGSVIAKLTEEKGGHIPYRDSKLTRILQSSLSGNARVSVICTISPSFLNVEESHNTLKFAARVKKIITKAHTNQVMDDKALLEKYRREITELKAQLLLTAAGQQDLGQGGGRGFQQQQQQQSAADSNLSHLLERERLKHEEEMIEMNLVRNALKERIDQLTKLILTSQSINTKGVPSSTTGDLAEGPVSSSSAMGRYTVETTADGTVLEFPKEIESRLARKDTIVRQLQSELEAQQEKVALMKAALQKTAKGESVDIVRTLAKVDMEPPREKFLIEKRASIKNLNGMAWQDGGGASAAAGGGGTVGRNAGQGTVKRVLRDPYAPTPADTANTTSPTAAWTSPISDDGDDTASLLILPDGEQLPIDDYDDDDLVDTPWNRAELHSLRQAKRELEIVVIEQEKKLEDMVAFEDSDEFRNLVLELEEHREKIVGMEEEREGLKATIIELRNNLRRFELAKGLGIGNGNGVGGGMGGGGGRIPFSPPGSSSPSPSHSSPVLSATTTTSTAMPKTVAAAAASRIQELEQMVQRERKLRMEEQARNMSRIASLEAEVTILKAEQSIHDLS